MLNHPKAKTTLMMDQSSCLSQVKNIKGSLHAAIDPKMNHFLAKTQKHLMEAQPLMKKYNL